MRERKVLQGYQNNRTDNDYCQLLNTSEEQTKYDHWLINRQNR